MKTNKTNNTLSATTAVTTAMEATNKTVYNSIVDGVPAPKETRTKLPVSLFVEGAPAHHVAYLNEAIEQMKVTGLPFAIIMIAIDDLYVFSTDEGGYQRPIDLKKANNMEKNFDMKRFTPIMVNYRDGRFNVVDGQTHALVGKRVGVERCFAQLTIGDTLEEEARRFYEQDNCSTSVNGFDKFLARVVGREANASLINKVCDKYGVEIRRCRGRLAPKVVCSIRMMDKIVKNYGENGLEFVFQTILELGWDKYDNGFAEQILQIYAAYPYCVGNKANYAKLFSNLLALGTPSKLIAHAADQFNNPEAMSGKNHVFKYVLNLFTEKK